MTYLRNWIFAFIFIFCVSMSKAQDYEDYEDWDDLESIYTEPQQQGRALSAATAVAGNKNFYTSNFEGTWEESRAYCKRTFGASGSLAKIESEQEYKIIQQILEARSTKERGYLADFWIGGYYYPSSNTFYWESNNQLVSIAGWGYSPWGPKLPALKDQFTRLFLHHPGHSITAWSYAQTYEKKRHICEQVKDGGGGGGGDHPCSKKRADVTFGLDISYSMRYVMSDGVDFIYNFMTKFTAQPGNRMALFLYNDEKVWWIFSLTDTLSKDEMARRILKIRYDGTQGEDHAMAINTGATHALKSQVAGVDKTKATVLVTDGEVAHRNQNREAFNAAVGSFARYVHVYVVGMDSEKIKDEPDKQDLLSIAANRPMNIFKVGGEVKMMEAICTVR